MFPEEIEFDLLLRGIDLFDWHTAVRRGDGQLKLSSRRLLVVLRRLPEDSEFKTALRDGDWDSETYIKAGILNELRIARVDNAAMNGHKMEPVLLRSPRQIVEDDQIRQAREAARDRIRAQLHGKTAAADPSEGSRWL